MSKSMTLARPYARAAYIAARDDGQTAQWSQALAFAAHVAGDPQAATLLGDPRLTREDAARLVAPEGASEAMRNFFALLTANGRLAVLPEISGLFEQARAESEHIVRATITSASAMTAGELESIKAALKRRFGREVEVETAVDASLIGGAVIDAGEVVIDGSLRGKLQRLQNALAG
ncbi:F0F1 ATP synthase subunit delta [Solilutibacter silvestris]|uniref:ATP synthase subunit delta n=1 Tax=Solilutibacter silvestris TaxID=1645665 RepID=A0A2K1Q1U4_9GAMM|nr:F0F1 ATP synthase subunit delta [Lysobacter silvestris]PNS09003.1 ATP synthase F1, delta subunit [Lysobacter silvestris]